MGTQPKDEDDALRLFTESLASEIFTDHVSKAEVDQDLLDAGCDPEAIGKRGAALVQELLEKRRLNWQAAARAKQASFASRAVERQSAPKPRRSRDEMLGAINAYRTDPAMGNAVSFSFRKRKPEESTEDELAELLDELELLHEMKTDGKKTDG
jgi:hypothetical protein